jgi:hypothetical protein
MALSLISTQFLADEGEGLFSGEPRGDRGAIRGTEARMA